MSERATHTALASTEAPVGRPDAAPLRPEEQAALSRLVATPGLAHSVAALAGVHANTVVRASEGGALRPETARRLRAFLALS